MIATMFALLHSLAMFVIDFFSDRALLVWMTRLWPGLLGAG